MWADDVPPGMACLLTDWEYSCFNTSVLYNETSNLLFETPHADRFLQFPDASGRVISTGNLDDITALGVQGTPITGFSIRHGTAASIGRLDCALRWSAMGVCLPPNSSR